MDTPTLLWDNSSMPVYAVIATKNAEEVGQKISTDHKEAFMTVTGDVWLVDSGKTTRELSESLGIRTGKVGSGLVIPLVNYSGRAQADIWEWLSIYMPKE